MPQAKCLSLALTVLAVFFVVGCSGQQAREERAKRLILEPAEADKLGYSSTWSLDLGLPDLARLQETAVIGDVIVVTEKRNNLVTAISARDGSVLWRREVGTKLERLLKPFGDIGGDDDYFFVPSEYRLFKVKKTDGSIAGVSILEQAIVASPVVVPGRAIFGGSNGKVFSHSLIAGRSSWNYQLASGGIVAPPVVFGNTVLVTSVGGVYIALTVDRGEVQWAGRTFDRISATSILTNQGVWIPSEDGTLYAVQRLDGRDRWKYRATKPLTRDPIIHRNAIYLPIKDVGLVALSPLRGNVLWEKESQALPIGVTPRGLLLNDRTKLYTVDTQTGQTLRQVPTLWLQDVILADNDAVYLVSPYGKLQRIDLKR